MKKTLIFLLGTILFSFNLDAMEYESLRTKILVEPAILNMPSKEELIKVFNQEGLQDFIEKTKIIEYLSGDLYILGVYNAIDEACKEYSKTMSGVFQDFRLKNKKNKIHNLIIKLFQKQNSSFKRGFLAIKKEFDKFN